MKRHLFHIPRIRRAHARKPEPGSMPGTIRPSTETFETRIHVIDYDGEKLEQTQVSPEELARWVNPGKPDPARNVTWVDIHGVHDTALLRHISSLLGLHALTVEDIAHVHQRPKLEVFDGYVFVVLRAIRRMDNEDIDNEQISFIIRDGLVVTFQERPGDGFTPVRNRLLENAGIIRHKKAEYLFYALLDAVIDNYFPVLEQFSLSMEQLEEQIRENPAPGLSGAVHAMRRELRQLYRAVWPLREVTRQLSSGEIGFFTPEVRASFRDCTDHVMQVAEYVESHRERAGDLGELYYTLVSEKTNQVMKTLTIVSTIFIPLTFLCGLYGMNFNTAKSRYNMPELNWEYGYPVVLGVMLLLGLGMLGLFYLKGWIGKR